ncbi:hypothetical protein CBR_g41492 [Chara braunii]|uniref:CCHC-type domain-containing protein n=1 Tax=Chara braunii TaxID=69332 RepID=A0A388LW01_CHABU|nr:hypothetical protein CBR_g41492 [Chara braunii]|eukprot:GBG86498.1 hypothetical protein CBR_g41492 [Chara braunii]
MFLTNGPGGGSQGNANAAPSFSNGGGQNMVVGQGYISNNGFMRGGGGTGGGGGVCYNCGKFGHIACDCWAGRNRNPGNPHFDLELEEMKEHFKQGIKYTKKPEAVELLARHRVELAYDGFDEGQRTTKESTKMKAFGSPRKEFTKDCVTTEKKTQKPVPVIIRSTPVHGDTGLMLTSPLKRGALGVFTRLAPQENYAEGGRYDGRSGTFSGSSTFGGSSDHNDCVDAGSPRKDPMRRIARALHQFIKQLPANSTFYLNSVSELAERLEGTSQQLRASGCLQAVGKCYDVKEMFSRIPHAAVIQSVRELLRLYEDKGRRQVRVSMRGKICVISNNRRKMEGYVSLPLRTIMEGVKYDLTHSIVKCGGKIVRQVFGIPMGKSTSPILASITCAMAEMRFIRELGSDRKLIGGWRIMDDITIIVGIAHRVSNKDYPENLFEAFESIYDKNLEVIRKDECGATWDFVGGSMLICQSPLRIRFIPSTKNTDSLYKERKLQFQSMQDYNSYLAKSAKKGVLTTTIKRLWDQTMSKELVLGAIGFAICEANLRGCPGQFGKGCVEQGTAKHAGCFGLYGGLEQEMGRSPVYRYLVVGQKVNNKGVMMLRCTFCNKVFQGSQFQPTRHFTQTNYCKDVSDEALYEITRRSQQKFESDQMERVARYAAERGVDVPGTGGVMGGEAGRQPVEGALGGVGGDGGGGDTEEGAIDVDREARAVETHREELAEELEEVRQPFWIIGATLLSDGRKSRDGRPIVNFLAAGSRGVVVYTTINREGEPDDAVHVLRRWVTIFHEFNFGGLQRFNAICTDSASAYVGAARALASSGIPPAIRRITWLLCSVHVCNKLLSHIGTSCDAFLDAITRARVQVVFFKTHQAALYFFRKRSPNKGLVLSCETRFASVYSMLERLLALQDALQAMMRGDDGREFAFIPWSVDVCDMARWVRRQIRWEPWWHTMATIVHITQPVMELLRRMDRGGQYMSLMIEWTQDLVRRVTYACAPLGRVFVDRIIKRVQARTQHMLEPAHCAGFLLNPRRRHVEYFSGEVRDYPRWLVRQAKRYILTQTGYEEDGVEYIIACRQFEDFHMQQGTFGDWGGGEGRDRGRACSGDRETIDYVLPWQRDEGMLDCQAGLELEPVRTGTRRGMTPEEIARQVALITRDPIGVSAPPAAEAVFGRRASIFRPYPREDDFDEEPVPEAADDPALRIPHEIDETHLDPEEDTRAHTAGRDADRAKREMMGGEEELWVPFGEVASTGGTGARATSPAPTRQESSMPPPSAPSRAPPSPVAPYEPTTSAEDTEELASSLPQRGLLHRGGVIAVAAATSLLEEMAASVLADEAPAPGGGDAVEGQAGGAGGAAGGAAGGGAAALDGLVAAAAGAAGGADAVEGGMPGAVEEEIGTQVEASRGGRDERLMQQFLTEQYDPVMAGMTPGRRRDEGVGDARCVVQETMMGLVVPFSGLHLAQGRQSQPVPVAVHGVPPPVITDLGSEPVVGPPRLPSHFAPQEVRRPLDADELAREVVRDVTCLDRWVFDQRLQHPPWQVIPPVPWGPASPVWSGSTSTGARTAEDVPGVSGGVVETAPCTRDLPPPPPRPPVGDPSSSPTGRGSRSPHTPGRSGIQETTVVVGDVSDTALFGRTDIDLDSTRRVTEHTARLQPGLGPRGGRMTVAREVAASGCEPQRGPDRGVSADSLEYALMAAMCVVHEQTPRKRGVPPRPRPVPAEGGDALGETSGAEGLGMPRGSRREQTVTEASARVVVLRKAGAPVTIEEDDPETDVAMRVEDADYEGEEEGEEESEGGSDVVFVKDRNNFRVVGAVSGWEDCSEGIRTFTLQTANGKNGHPDDDAQGVRLAWKKFRGFGKQATMLLFYTAITSDLEPSVLLRSFFDDKERLVPPTRCLDVPQEHRISMPIAYVGNDEDRTRTSELSTDVTTEGATGGLDPNYVPEQQDPSDAYEESEPEGEAVERRHAEGAVAEVARAPVSAINEPSPQEGAVADMAEAPVSATDELSTRAKTTGVSTTVGHPVVAEQQRGGETGRRPVAVGEKRSGKESGSKGAGDEDTPRLSSQKKKRTGTPRQTSDKKRKSAGKNPETPKARRGGGLGEGSSKGKRARADENDSEDDKEKVVHLDAGYFLEWKEGIKKDVTLSINPERVLELPAWERSYNHRSIDPTHMAYILRSMMDAFKKKGKTYEKPILKLAPIAGLPSPGRKAVRVTPDKFNVENPNEHWYYACHRAVTGNIKFKTDLVCKNEEFQKAALRKRPYFNLWGLADEKSKKKEWTERLRYYLPLVMTDDETWMLGMKFYDEWEKGHLLAPDGAVWTKRPPTMDPKVTREGQSFAEDNSGHKRVVYNVCVTDPEMWKGKKKRKQEDRDFFVQMNEPDVHCWKDLGDFTDAEKRRILRGLLDLDIVWVQQGRKKLIEQGKHEGRDNDDWNASFFRTGEQLMAEYASKGLDEKLWAGCRKWVTDHSYLKECPQYLGCPSDKDVAATRKLVNHEKFPTEWKRVVLSVLKGERGKWVRRSQVKKHYQIRNSVWADEDRMYFFYHGDDLKLNTPPTYEGRLSDDDAAALGKRQKVTPSDISETQFTATTYASAGVHHLKGFIYKEMERNPGMLSGHIEFFCPVENAVMFIGKAHAQVVWHLLKSGRHVVAIEGDTKLLNFLMIFVAHEVHMGVNNCEFYQVQKEVDHDPHRNMWFKLSAEKRANVYKFLFLDTRPKLRFEDDYKCRRDVVIGALDGFHGASREAAANFVEKIEECYFDNGKVELTLNYYKAQFTEEDNFNANDEEEVSEGEEPLDLETVYQKYTADAESVDVASTNDPRRDTRKCEVVTDATFLRGENVVEKTVGGSYSPRRTDSLASPCATGSEVDKGRVGLFSAGPGCIRHPSGRVSVEQNEDLAVGSISAGGGYIRSSTHQLSSTDDPLALGMEDQETAPFDTHYSGSEGGHVPLTNASEEHARGSYKGRGLRDAGSLAGAGYIRRPGLRVSAEQKEELVVRPISTGSGSIRSSAEQPRSTDNTLAVGVEDQLCSGFPDVRPSKIHMATVVSGDCNEDEDVTMLEVEELFVRHPIEDDLVKTLFHDSPVVISPSSQLLTPQDEVLVIRGSGGTAGRPVELCPDAPEKVVCLIEADIKDLSRLPSQLDRIMASAQTEEFVLGLSATCLRKDLPQPKVLDEKNTKEHLQHEAIAGKQ